MKSTIEELVAFRTVVDTGSITAASEQLAQTVSGISRALSRLEQKLDTTLLRRTTRRLELTEEGAAFLQRTRAISTRSTTPKSRWPRAASSRPAGCA